MELRKEAMRQAKIVNPAMIPEFAVQVAGLGALGFAAPWEGCANTVLHICANTCYFGDALRASLPKCPDRWLSVTSGPPYLSEQATPHPERQARKRKHTPGAQLQHQESASSSGPSPPPGDQPMAEIVAGSLYRKSKERVRAGLGSIRHRGFSSACFSRAGLNLHVLTNLPPSGILLKALALGFGIRDLSRKAAKRSFYNRQTMRSANSARRKKLQTSEGQDKTDSGY